jgi:hypothetical protein
LMRDFSRDDGNAVPLLAAYARCVPEMINA